MARTTARRIAHADVPEPVRELLAFYADNLEPDACWPWPYARNPQGYGVVSAGGRHPRVSRCVAAELYDEIRACPAARWPAAAAPARTGSAGSPATRPRPRPAPASAPSRVPTGGPTRARPRPPAPPP